jgi:hypothetical protein
MEIKETAEGLGQNNSAAADVLSDEDSTGFWSMHLIEPRLGHRLRIPPMVREKQVI